MLRRCIKTEEFLLAAATSADIFAAVLGLRAAGIKLPYFSALAAAVSGAVILWLSASAAAFIGDIFPIGGAVYISKAILAAIGIYMIINALKAAPPSDDHGGHLTCSELMNNPESADADNSKSISLKEGAAMGIALSADSVLTGVSAGIGGISPLRIFILALLMGVFACIAGTCAGGFLRERIGKKFPAGIIGGLILIIISAME